MRYVLIVSNSLYNHNPTRYPLKFHGINAPLTLQYQMTKKSTQGGNREGSGRRSLYDEPTKSISFRVPESKASAIKSIALLVASLFYLKDKPKKQAVIKQVTDKIKEL